MPVRDRLLEERPMNPPRTKKYTCREYRQEMLLLGLKRQLENPALSEAEKRRLAAHVSELEQQMGME